MIYTNIRRMVWFGGGSGLSVVLILDYTDWLMISLMIFTKILRMFWLGGGGSLSVV